VVINRVMPASPADKASLSEGDIIVQAGGNEINFLDELSEIVKNSAGEPIQLEVLRDGEKMQIEVTPAKQGERRKMLFWREQEKAKEGHGAQGEAREQLEGVLRKLRESNTPFEQAGGRTGSPGRGMIYRAQPGMPGGMVMPGGVAVPAWSPMPSGLPGDMSVTIQKRGNKPAKVTVKQGEKLWQTTEHELGMLPPPALGYVARMLGRPMMPGSFPGPGGFGMPAARGFAVPGTPVPGQPQRFEIRLGEDGKAQVIQEQGGSREGSPEGMRIKIRAAGEGGEPLPEPKGGNVKWQELRRKAQGNDGQNARDIQIFQLQEQIQKLRHQLEERQGEKQSSEKPRQQKKGKNREQKAREKSQESE
jgi:hypothetical protein